VSSVDITGSAAGRRRAGLAGLVVSVLVVTSTITSRPADAAATAPPATGWYVTSQRAAAGVELSTVRRDDPLTRAHVAMIPRTALYRLRTVMASEQLIGGYGRDITTNLCARVHCHAATNGDRWDMIGHDAGRLTGAVALAGELVATQPIPPADPYAHLLIGRDGSMDGTIAWPIPVTPAVSAGDQELSVDVNRQPVPGRTAVLTRRYSSESRTPPGTVEYLLSATSGTVERATLAPLSRREGSGPIPHAGVVVAVNGDDSIRRAEAWWAEVLEQGSATYDTGLGGVREIIGGSPLLLDQGGYGFPTDRSDGRQPRTIVGWDATRVWLVTIDGRRPGWSGGATYVEAAQLMRWLGATDALNLDGGGSTTFVGFGRLGNWPSDGHQRPVASALVVMPPENRIGTPPPGRSLEPACPPGRVPLHRFDDAVTGVHASAIDCVAWWGITAGATSRTYEPLEPVRRDQMATFLARYLHTAGVALPSNPPNAFPDDERSVHRLAIDALAQLGVIGGRGDGRYAPAASVTRGQMATFLSRAVALANGAPLPRTADFFADDSGDVHEPNINALTEAAIAGGTGDGRYRSTLPVSRAQMASFLARSLSSSVEAGRATPPG
jgi:hypothetical protein